MTTVHMCKTHAYLGRSTFFYVAVRRNVKLQCWLSLVSFVGHVGVFAQMRTVWSSTKPMKDVVCFACMLAWMFVHAVFLCKALSCACDQKFNHVLCWVVCILSCCYRCQVLIFVPDFVDSCPKEWHLHRCYCSVTP